MPWTGSFGKVSFPPELQNSAHATAAARYDLHEPLSAVLNPDTNHPYLTGSLSSLFCQKSIGWAGVASECAAGGKAGRVCFRGRTNLRNNRAAKGLGGVLERTDIWNAESTGFAARDTGDFGACSVLKQHRAMDSLEYGLCPLPDAVRPR